MMTRGEQTTEGRAFGLAKAADAAFFRACGEYPMVGTRQLIAQIAREHLSNCESDGSVADPARVALAAALVVYPSTNRHTIVTWFDRMI